MKTRHLRGRGQGEPEGQCSGRGQSGRLVEFKRSEVTLVHQNPTLFTCDGRHRRAERGINKRELYTMFYRSNHPLF